MNIVDEHLELKMSMEENRITNYLGLSINRNANNVDRMITMPNSERAVKQDWNTILIMAQNNGFPVHLIH
jgi:hypothetical protein